MAERLKIDKSSASRRVRVALDKGYLRNDEDRRGKPSKLALADPLPDDVEILPTVEALRECCSVAVDSEPPQTPAGADDNGSGGSEGGASDAELERFESLLELDAIARGELASGGPSELAARGLLDEAPATHWERWSADAAARIRAGLAEPAATEEEPRPLVAASKSTARPIKRP